MSLTQEINALQETSFFKGMDISQIKLLAFAAERVCFLPNEVIFKENTAGNFALILLKGHADVFIHKKKIATLGPNEIAGEMSLLCDIPRTATLIAKSDIEALYISKELFFQMLDQFPKMSIEILKTIATRLHQTNQQI